MIALSKYIIPRVSQSASEAKVSAMARHEAAGDAVVDAVLTASRTLVAVAERSLGAAAEETTLAQYRALVVLASRGPQRMVDLARALEVTPSTAGRMCDRLLRKGLIRRYRARADRREVQVSITAAGRAVVDRGDRAAAGAAGRDPRPAHARPAVGGGRGAAGVRGRGRGGARQPVAGGAPSIPPATREPAAAGHSREGAGVTGRGAARLSAGRLAGRAGRPAGCGPRGRGCSSSRCWSARGRGWARWCSGT